jgi:hypothetical protein
VSANPQFTGAPDPVASDAFYVLLFEAILRAETVTRESIPYAALAALERACIAYAAALPKGAREMIARKAEAVL